MISSKVCLVSFNSGCVVQEQQHLVNVKGEVWIVGLKVQTWLLKLPVRRRPSVWFHLREK